MLSKIFEEDVKPLVLNVWFRLGVLFFVVLSYGYFAVNLSYSKDCLCPGHFLGVKILFSTAYMMRWGMSVIGAITGGFGSFSNFVSVMIGVPLMVLSSLLFCGAMNFIMGYRSRLAALAFVSLSVTSAWYAEIVTYPNMLPVLGCGMTAAVFSAISMYELYIDDEKGSVWRAAASLSIAVGTYEVCFIYAFMLLAILLLLTWFRDGNRTWPTFRFIGKIFIAVVFAVAVKFILSYGLMLVGGLFSPEVMRPMFDGCGTESAYAAKGIVGGLRGLVVGLVVELGLRTFSYFPSFFVSLSLAVWLVFVIFVSITRRSLYSFCVGVGVLVLIFFFPLTQGVVSGQLRKLVPMAPLLLAVECYLILNIVKKHRLVVSLFVVAFLIVFSSNLSVSLQDAVYRYSLDQDFAIQLVHDIEQRFSTRLNKKVVVVGSAAHDAYRYGYADGHAWRGVTIGSPTWMEKKLGRRDENGGFGAQGTLLDSSPGRRDELYHLLTRVGRQVYVVPTDEECDFAEELVRKQSVPAYPQDGSIIATDELIIVNLGI